MRTATDTGCHRCRVGSPRSGALRLLGGSELLRPVPLFQGAPGLRGAVWHQRGPGRAGQVPERLDEGRPRAAVEQAGHRGVRDLRQELTDHPGKERLLFLGKRVGGMVQQQPKQQSLRR